MTPDAEAVLQLSVTLSLVGGVVGVLYYVWYALALSKLFTKLGAESWRGWVPILNEMEILTRGGVPGWSVVYYFIPVVNLYGLYLKITAVHRINVQLGRGAGMTVLAVVLPPVWASILGWGATSAVAGVNDRRVAGGLANADAAPHAAATGPLGAPPAPSAAPFTPAASDPSGYALPVVQQPPAAAAGPAFSAPAATPLPPAPSSGPPAPPAAAPAAGLIQNPWAQPGTAAASAPAPAGATPPPPPAAAPVSAAAPAPAGPPAPSGPPAPPAPPADTGFIVPPPSIGLPPVAPSAAAPSAPPAAPAAPVFVPAPTPASAPVVPSAPVTPPSTPAVFAPDNGGDDDLDNTIVVDRRPVVPWRLRTDDGFVASLTASKVVLGRNPASSEMDVQAIAIPDSTKTLSKTHARLELVDGSWTLTDLHSTNGVIVIAADGSETLIDVDQTVPLQSRFLLGKVGMAVSFEEEQRS